mgnify:CR=1 FL=1
MTLVLLCVDRTPHSAPVVQPQRSFLPDPSLVARRFESMYQSSPRPRVLQRFRRQHAQQTSQARGGFPASPPTPPHVPVGWSSVQARLRSSGQPTAARRLGPTPPQRPTPLHASLAPSVGPAAPQPTPVSISGASPTSASPARVRAPTARTTNSNRGSAAATSASLSVPAEASRSRIPARKAVLSPVRAGTGRGIPGTGTMPKAPVVASANTLSLEEELGVDPTEVFAPGGLLEQVASRMPPEKSRGSGLPAPTASQPLPRSPPRPSRANNGVSADVATDDGSAGPPSAAAWFQDGGHADVPVASPTPVTPPTGASHNRDGKAVSPSRSQSLRRSARRRVATHRYSPTGSPSLDDTHSSTRPDGMGTGSSAAGLSDTGSGDAGGVQAERRRSRRTRVALRPYSPTAQDQMEDALRASRRRPSGRDDSHAVPPRDASRTRKASRSKVVKSAKVSKARTTSGSGGERKAKRASNPSNSTCSLLGALRGSSAASPSRPISVKSRPRRVTRRARRKGTGRMPRPTNPKVPFVECCGLLCVMWRRSSFLVLCGADAVLCAAHNHRS